MNNNHKLVGLSNMATRLGYRGGAPQQNRMIRDKLNSMKKATLYSYQGAKVKDVNNGLNIVAPALINPNKLKPDYDDKVICESSPFNDNFDDPNIYKDINIDDYLDDEEENNNDDFIDIVKKNK